MFLCFFLKIAECLLVLLLSPSPPLVSGAWWLSRASWGAAEPAIVCCSQPAKLLPLHGRANSIRKRAGLNLLLFTSVKRKALGSLLDVSLSIFKCCGLVSVPFLSLSVYFFSLSISLSFYFYLSHFLSLFQSASTISISLLFNVLSISLSFSKCVYIYTLSFSLYIYNILYFSISLSYTHLCTHA